VINLGFNSFTLNSNSSKWAGIFPINNLSPYCLVLEQVIGPKFGITCSWTTLAFETLPFTSINIEKERGFDLYVGIEFCPSRPNYRGEKGKKIDGLLGKVCIL